MSDSPERRTCGLHSELARGDGIRISRCPCGTVHLHMTKTGVSLQLGAPDFEELVLAMVKARRAIGVEDAPPEEEEGALN